MEHQQSIVDRKIRFVISLFSDGPREYDFLLKVLSFGRDWHWRNSVVDSAAVPPDGFVLDIACGTGLLSYQFAARGTDVVGIDVTREMLLQGWETAPNLHRKVDFIQARAECLPIRENSFDAAVISLATRNVSDVKESFAEMSRCVKKGRKVISMDFTCPNGRLFRPFYYFYIFKLLPTLGMAISRHWNGIFVYLANSIKRSRTPEQLASIMNSIGMSQLSIKRMTKGVTALVSATKQ